MTDKKYITREQIHELTKSIPRLRDKAIFQTAYFGGLRLSELAELRREDLDFKKDFVEINISTGRSNRKVIVVEPKETLKEYIEKYDISDELDGLWRSLSGQELSKTRIAMIVSETSDSDITFHTLRYSRVLYFSHKMTEQTFYNYFGYSSSSNVIQKYRKRAESENLKKDVFKDS